ncbi:MAG: penicillin-binding transpeptidase domain-containing protein [Comamonadaceae bacterium]|nr:penicillin-binding transpeptidase domain-containing protein [Comamonadaceae bacterium]
MTPRWHAQLFARRRRRDRRRPNWRPPSSRNPSASSSCSAARLAIAGALVLAAFGAAVRALRLPAGDAARALPDAGRDEPHRRSCRSRPTAALITDRNGVVLAQSYSAYTLEIQPAQGRATSTQTIDELAHDRRDPAARPQALHASCIEESQELREPADPHAPDRRGGRALRRQPLPLPRRRDQGAAVPPLSARRGRPRTSSATSAASTTATWSASSEWDDDRQLQGHRLHRQGRRRAHLRARAARHDRRRGGRGRRRRPRGAHAVAHAADRRQQPACCRSTSSCRRSPRRRSATAAARWSRSSRRPATCSRSSPSPASTRTSSSTASTRPAGRLLNESPDKPLLNRALRGAYPPGSTIKPFLALAALDLGQAHRRADDLRPRLLPAARRAHRFRD